MTEKRKAKLLWFGLGGHSIEYSTNGSKYSGMHLSGYDNPDSIDLTEYHDNDFSDCLVIDKISVLESNPGLAITLPMVNVNLPENEIDTFDPELISPVLMSGLEGSFKTLATLSKVKEYHGLDSIGRKLYVALWKKHGARIGKVINNQIVWDD